MDELTGCIAEALAKYYEEAAKKIHLVVEPVDDESIWTKPHRYGNAIGHLLLHVTGNLNDRIGAQVLGLSYQRDRAREFSDPTRRGKAELLKDFDEAIAMTLNAIGQQSAESWTSPYPALTGPEAPSRLAIFIRCLTHCSHHLGQMIYLAKELGYAGTTK